MGWLNKIKSLFTKKGTSIDISVINTSLTYIRDYSKLDASEKRKVKEEIESFINKKKVKEDQGNKYQELIKYTQDEDSAIRDLQEILRFTLLKYDKLYQSIGDTDDIIATAKRINYILLSASECDEIRDNFISIRRNLEIKFHVINGIINQFKNYKILNREQRKEYLANQGTIFSERDIIKTTIKNIDNLLAMMKKQERDSAVLGKSYDMLEKLNSLLNTNHELLGQTKKTLVEIIKAFRNKTGFHDEEFRREIKERIIDKIDFFRADFDDDLAGDIAFFIDRNDNQIIKELYKKYRDGGLYYIDTVSLVQKEKKLCFTKYFLARNLGWEYLINELPNNLLLELYKIAAKYIHMHRVNVFPHRNDYQIYLKEVEDLTNKCLSTPVEEWRSCNISPYAALLQFKGNGIDYSRMCGDYLTDEIREQMRVAFAKLNWLVKIADSSFGGDQGNYLDEPGADLWHDDSFLKYFNRFSEELLTKVEEKFGVKLEELLFLTRDKNYRVDFSQNTRDLINLLNDVWNKTIYVSPSKEYPITYVQDNKSNTISSLNIQWPVRLEDFYYYLRSKGNTPKISFKKRAPFYGAGKSIWLFSGKSDNLSNFIALIRLKQLENQYDKRILILPKINNNMNYWKCLMSPDSEFTASFAHDVGILFDFLYNATYRQKVKYLFVKENVIKAYKLEVEINSPTSHLERLKNSGYITSGGENLTAWELTNTYNQYFSEGNDHINYDGLTIIIVPDDTSYGELSDILNQELKKDNKDDKRLGLIS